MCLRLLLALWSVCGLASAATYEVGSGKTYTTLAAVPALSPGDVVQISAGTFRSEASRITVKEAADRFLLHCEGRRTRGERMSTQNYKTMEGHIRNYICPDPKRQSALRWKSW